MREKRKIETIVRFINEAWTQDRLEDLNRFFHQDMVIIGPDARVAGRGRDACISSYRSFAEAAEIHSFAQNDFRIEAFENTSVVTYSFSLSYEMDGKIFRDSGRDMFVFTREREDWMAVWRMILPLAPDMPPA